MSSGRDLPVVSRPQHLLARLSPGSSAPLEKAKKAGIHTIYIIMRSNLLSKIETSYNLALQAQEDGEDHGRYHPSFKYDASCLHAQLSALTANRPSPPRTIPRRTSSLPKYTSKRRLMQRRVTSRGRLIWYADCYRAESFIFQPGSSNRAYEQDVPSGGFRRLLWQTRKFRAGWLDQPARLGEAEALRQPAPAPVPVLLCLVLR
jgi:hypothetical protein